jgi:hypothetical protein
MTTQIIPKPEILLNKIQARESIVRILRDSGRSLFWIVSGRTGASFNPRFRPPFYAFRQLHSRQLHTRSDI